MRKRTIIAIIFTIITVAATYKFWLHFSPMPVDMDIQGKGSEHIEVQLNKKDNDEFRKIKTGAVDVKLSETGHAQILVDRARFPKRIKIIFSSRDGAGNLSVSNINLRQGKLNLDLNKFKIDGADYKIQENKLLLKFKKENITLTYPDTLKIRAAFKFDFMLLVILTTLTFLLAYKISDYIADFKTLKGKSRVDIIFLTIFFIFLFIPASHINQDETSGPENRALAKWQPLFLPEYGINYNFGNDFNSWFNDRFKTRDKLISIYMNYIKYPLSNNYVDVPMGYMYKKSGWMFYNQDVGEINHSFTPLTKNEINDYTNNLIKLIHFCKNKNIKLYITILPTKEFLYKEEDIEHHYGNEKTKDFVAKVKEKTGFEIIYPVDELLNLKKHGYVCYKTDHHLTDLAQYEIYTLLIRKIKKDFPDINVTPKSDFNISYNNLIRWDNTRDYVNGYNYQRAGLHYKSLLNTKYTYYDYKYPDKIVVTAGEYPLFTHTNKSKKYKIFLIGTSFMESLTYFLNTSFNKIVKYRFNLPLNYPPQRKTSLDMTAYIPLIEKQKPDILLLVFSTGSVDCIGGMFPQGEN